MNETETAVSVVKINDRIRVLSNRRNQLSEVKTEDDFKSASEVSWLGKGLKNVIEIERKRKTDPLYRAQIEIKAEYDQLKSKVSRIVEPINSKIQHYLRIEAEKRAEAERQEAERQEKIRQDRLEIERKRLEALEKVRIAEQEALRNDGELTEEQTQTIAEATEEMQDLKSVKNSIIEASVPIEIPKQVKGAVTTRTSVSGEVHDLRLLIKAVADGYVNAGVLKVSQAGINNYIKLQKDVEGLFDFEVLRGYGIRIIEKETLVNNVRYK